MRLIILRVRKIMIRMVKFANLDDHHDKDITVEVTESKEEEKPSETEGILC